VELADRSRRPHSSPKATAKWLVEAIVAARKQRPSWGPKKVLAVLARANPAIAFPSASTFAKIFRDNGLVRPRRRKRRTPPYSAPLAHAGGPNAVWCIDFKGQFSVGKTRCYPLTISDAHSRYLIACVALKGTHATPVRRALEGVFNEFGLPEAIRSDNGSPFAGRGPAGLSRLSAWWLKLGIRHERIEPGKPEQNGRHERMHLTLKLEAASPPAASLAAQQRQFDRFRKRFNGERPHEALGQRTPREFYEPSRRSLPSPPSGRDFAYSKEYQVLRASKHGTLSTVFGTVSLGAAFACELVGLRWRDSLGEVSFGPLLLGHVERIPRSRRARFIRVATSVSSLRAPSWHGQ
jgi:putative transposase